MYASAKTAKSARLGESDDGSLENSLNWTHHENIGARSEQGRVSVATAPLMAALGTLRWVERTGGKLAWHDRLRMIAEGVRARAAAQERIAIGARFRHVEVDEILPPDTAMAREAVGISEVACLPFLHFHNLRAYFWARLLDDGKRAFDDEAVFVAMMLHDLGLTEGHRLSDEHQHCFTNVGARAAEVLARRHQWSDRRSAMVANAITLHLNVTVHARHGREAQMVREGSGADVAGLGLDVLHSDQIEAVVQKFPRLNFKKAIGSNLKQEADAHPCCRIAFMLAKLGFGRLIERAPMFVE